MLKKTNEVWEWIALCRKTRQVAVYAFGDWSKETCLRLWESIPPASDKGHCFMDFWAAYSVVIPGEQRIAVSKETGETTPGTLCFVNAWLALYA